MYTSRILEKLRKSKDSKEFVVNSEGYEHNSNYHDQQSAVKLFHEPLLHIKSETVSKNILCEDKSTALKDDIFPDVYVFTIKEEPSV